jgi:branched-chain amino acid transport system substrate-binding protein
MLKMSKGWMLLAALVAMLMVVAVACEDEEEEPTPTGTVTATATAAATETAEATATPAASPTDVGEVPGIDATQIKLGSHMPLTGPAASYGIIDVGQKAYFDYVNAELGGVCGRQIILKTEDDAYTASRAVEVVRRLLEDEEVFAIMGGFGTAAHAAVYKDLNEQGIPDFWVASGSNMWVEDPETYPYTFGGIPSYLKQEGPVMGEFIADNWPGAKVGVFGQNDDFGLEIEEGVREGLAGRNEVVDFQTYTTTHPDIRSQIINLRDAGAEVVAMAAIPEFAAFFIQQVRGQGWDVPIVASGVIADPIVFDLAGAQNVTDVYLVGYLIPPWEPEVPGVQEYLRVMETYAPDADPQRSFHIYGYAVGQLMTEVLSRSCDNLTRDGVVEAAESIKGWEQPVAWGPVSFSPTDHAPWESFVWSKGDPETRTWQAITEEVISKESTP